MSFVVFFLNFFFNACIQVNFVLVAKQWQSFTENWDVVHATFKKLFIVDIREATAHRAIRKWLVIYLITSAVSYFLYLFKGLTTKMCRELHHGDEWHQLFFEQIFPEFFKIIHYHYSLGFLILFVDFVAAFSSVFNDGFIIIMSMCLARNFQTFNEKLLLNLSVSFRFAFA